MVVALLAIARNMTLFELVARYIERRCEENARLQRRLDSLRCECDAWNTLTMLFPTNSLSCDHKRWPAWTDEVWSADTD
jgi:hypothetical protein